MKRIRRILAAVFVGACLFICGCATAPVSRIPSDKILLQNVCDARGVSWFWDDISQRVVLNYQGRTAKALAGSTVVAVNSHYVTLSAPVEWHKGSIIVPPDFKQKVVDTLIKKAEYVIKKEYTIVLDPGHGGRDPGAIGTSGLLEKTINLDIAKRLKANLEKKGMKVTMTRDSDVYIPLEERVEHTHKAKADLFISIHANASYSRRVKGFEVYYLSERDAQEQRVLYCTQDNNTVFDRFSMKKNSQVLDKIILDMMYDYKQDASRQLAGNIARRVSSDADLRNRGSHEAEFTVLKNTVIPAVLVEVGFLSNRAEEEKLKSNEYRQKIADSLARSVLGDASQ